MKEAIQKAQEVKAEVNTDSPSTIIADVSIIGYNLVSPAFLGVVETVLGLDEFKHSVKAIMFSPDQPMIDGHTVFAKFEPATQTAMLNMVHHWNAGVKLAKEDKSMISVRAHVWYNMLVSLFHELYHGAMGDVSDQPVEEVEKMCAEMADDAVHNFIRDYTCEPGPMAEEPFFGPRYMELFIKQIQGGTADWQKRQNDMHDEVHVFVDDEELIKSFRDWFRVTAQGDPEFADARWDEAPLPFEPDTPPEVDAVEETIVPEVLEEVIVATTDLPNGHGITEETVKMMDIGEDEVAENMDVMPELLLPEAAAVAAPTHARPLGAPAMAMVEPVTAQPAPPVGAHEPPVVEQTVTCMNTACGQPLGAGAKFCMFCATPSPPAHARLTAPAPVTAPVAPAVAVAAPRTMISNVAATPPGVFTNTYVKPLRTNLNNINYTTEQAKIVMEQVFHALLYGHIFEKCGYQIGHPQYDPTLIGAVLQPISLAHIPGVDGFLIGHDRMENNITHKNTPVLNGVVSGLFRDMKSSGVTMPFYSLYFNCNGTEVNRTLWPQNLWKRKGNDPNGEYSAPAMAAQQGHLQGWVVDGQTSGAFKIKFVNGVAEWQV